MAWCRTWALRPGSVGTAVAHSSSKSANDVSLSVLCALGQTAHGLPSGHRATWVNRLLEFSEMHAVAARGPVAAASSASSAALLVIAHSLLVWHGTESVDAGRTGCKVARGGPTWTASPVLAVHWRDTVPTALLCAPAGEDAYSQACALLQSLSITLPLAARAGSVDEGSIAKLTALSKALAVLPVEKLGRLDVTLRAVVLPSLLTSLIGV